MEVVSVKVAYAIGVAIMSTGGMLFTGWLILLLGELAQEAWIRFSNKFRGICKTESLIYEYRKNREKFLEWKESVEDG